MRLLKKNISPQRHRGHREIIFVPVFERKTGTNKLCDLIISKIPIRQIGFCLPSSQWKAKNK
jgi:hypothetical protein